MTTLTKFVRNVDDLSDDGGYKFRFRCDGCGDGFESQYVAASANLLKTAIDVFTLFRPFGMRSYAGRRIADNIDRGLRGKERDAAYERAVHAAQAHFRKCTACGRWVCPEHCFNADSGLCEGCAPDAREAAAKRAAQRKVEHAVAGVENGTAQQDLPVSCPGCGAQARGTKFCESCGMRFDALRCRSCAQPVSAGARFCGHCGGALA